MSSFIKRFLLSMVASKLERMAYRRRHNPAVDSLLREVNHRLARPRRHGHGHHYDGMDDYYGDYRRHGHYRRRKHW